MKTKAEKKAEKDIANTPIVIGLRPGTAAEKSLTFTLPEAVYNDSTRVKDVIEYGLRLTEDAGLRREGIRIQERLGTEMRNNYGVSANSMSIDPETKLSLVLENKMSPSGKKYREAQIIVASRQEGAFRDLGYRVE